MASSYLSKSPEAIRVLYAACGLVYRSGCGPSEHVVSVAKELGALPNIELTVLFAHNGDPLPPGPYYGDTLNDPGMALESGMETDSLVLGISPFSYLSHKKKVQSYALGAVKRHDVVIERMWGFGGILAKAFKRSKRGVILEENGPISWEGKATRPGDWLRRLYLALSNWRLKRQYALAGALIVQTENLAKRLVQDYGVREQKIRVIPNGVDLGRFKAILPKKEEGPLVLVYSGVLDDGHDLRPLCRAVRKTQLALELRILGSGPLGQELKKIAEGGSRIRLLGRRSPQEVVKHLEAADLCVAPYASTPHKRTGFQYSPLKMMEYAAAGRPVLAAGAVASGGAVQSGINGLFLKNNQEAWLNILENLPDRETLKNMGQKGRSLVEEMDWKEAADKYASLAQEHKRKMKAAPLPFANPENHYIKRLHWSLQQENIELTDPGHLPLKWILSNRYEADLIHMHWPESHYQFHSAPYSVLKWLYLALRLKIAHWLGYKIVWTAHNINAHNPRIRGLDRLVRKHLLRKAHSVLLGKGSEAALKEAFRINSLFSHKTIPHGHYIDSYGPEKNQESCKRRLNIPTDAKAYLFLGAIKPYKNLELLARVFAKWSPKDALLICAGRPENDRMVQGIKDPFESDPQKLRLFPDYVADDEIPIYLGVANFVVLPYKNIHMSGALVLALSYGRPVIAPALGLIPEYLPEGAGILYDPAEPDGLAKALSASWDLDWSAMGAKAKKFAADLDWSKIGSDHYMFYKHILEC